MTIPTYITLFRMILVPVYGHFLLEYGFSRVDGEPDGMLRFWCCALFAIASISDALDGIIAKKWKMESQLGAYLDPFADKMLLITSIVFMAQYSSWWWQLPIWFMVIIVLRDLMIIYGVWLLKTKKRPIYFRPHWTGKWCTCLQIAVISCYLLQWVTLGFVTSVLASVFTVWSGIVYCRHGWSLLHMPATNETPTSLQASYD